MKSRWLARYRPNTPARRPTPFSWDSKLTKYVTSLRTSIAGATRCETDWQLVHRIDQCEVSRARTRAPKVVKGGQDGKRAGWIDLLKSQVTQREFYGRHMSDGGSGVIVKPFGANFQFPLRLPTRDPSSMGGDSGQVKQSAHGECSKLHTSHASRLPHQGAERRPWRGAPTTLIQM